MRGREALGALGDRRFAWYFTARTVSTVGSAMAPIGLAFAVLHLFGSASALAQVLAARTAAMVVFLLIGGVVSDRMSRRTVLQVSHALTALTQGLAAVLVIGGHAHLWMLTGIEAVNGAVSAFTMPAMMGIVPLVVDRSRLQQANALLSFSRSGVTVVGPSVAGLLVVAVGPGWALAVDAVTYLLAIACLARVRIPGRVHDPDAPRTGMVHDLREGWQEFTARTWLWVVVLAFGLLNVIQGGVLGVLGPLVATRVPALGPGGWSLALSAEALGTVLMTLVMLRLVFRRPLRAGMLGIALVALPVAVLGVQPTTAPLLVAMLLAGAGIEVFGVAWTTALQVHVPDAVLARVASYDALGSLVALPVGTVAYGVLADRFALEPVLLVSAGLYVVLCGLTLASRSVRDLPHGAPQDADGRPLTPA